VFTSTTWQPRRRLNNNNNNNNNNTICIAPIKSEDTDTEALGKYTPLHVSHCHHYKCRLLCTLRLSRLLQIAPPVCLCVGRSVVKVKGKRFPYSLLSVGTGADPGVQAVSPQVTISHPPGGRLK